MTANYCSILLHQQLLKTQENWLRTRIIIGEKALVHLGEIDSIHWWWSTVDADSQSYSVKIKYICVKTLACFDQTEARMFLRYLENFEQQLSGKLKLLSNPSTFQYVFWFPPFLEVIYLWKWGSSTTIGNLSHNSTITRGVNIRRSRRDICSSRWIGILCYMKIAIRHLG